MLKSHQSDSSSSASAGLFIGALGIVFGDIGTSPLYALRECFHGTHSVAPSPENIYGVLSLFLWSLVLVISIKYLLIVMRADNDGEGGILALMSLVANGRETDQEENGSRTHHRSWIVLIGLFGAALLYGDGVITPAISVLSAMEGLEVATPLGHEVVVPLTIVVLTCLFLLQRFGTKSVGFIFGPIMLVWFLVLAALGIGQVISKPAVLAAINPLHALWFFAANHWAGFLVLGVVFLVVTGGEALYADMGHFGRRPIKQAWFGIVLPALLINYFGQGALLLKNAQHAENPFYSLADGWLLYPLVVLATLATIIASQAVISGAFSLTMQAVQLGYLPRLTIRHTSTADFGQVYIPAINTVLGITTIGVVLGFQSSARLASAYGVAVTTTMVITTFLIALVMRRLWHWNRAVTVAVIASMLLIDFSFFAANLLKFFDGGWFPLLIAALIMLVMTTWNRGRELLRLRLSGVSPSYQDFFDQLDQNPPAQVPGTVIYLAKSPYRVPPALTHNVRHNRVLHEQVAVVTTIFEKRPYVAADRRLSVEVPRPNFYRILIRYGFNQSADIPAALAGPQLEELRLKPNLTTYILGRETLLPTDRPGMAIWREMLFALMSRNATKAADYFHIPTRQVLEIGLEIEL